MIATSLLLTTILFMAFGFWLMDELKYLIPYEQLWQAYGTAILAYLAVLFTNVFAAIYWMNRKFFLEELGRKLFHFDKQLRTGESQLSEELADRLSDG
jgi:hypothetical protein